MPDHIGSDDAMSDDQSTDQADGTDSQTVDTEDVGDKGLAAIKAERDARRKAERDLKTLTTRLAELENAGKPELERTQGERDAATQRADAAEQRLKDATGKTAVLEAAAKLRAISTNAIFEMAKGRLEYDKDGDPTNVDVVIDAIRKSEPALFRAADGSGDGGQGGTPHVNEDNITPGLGRLAYAYATDSKTAKR